jgi:hypothetical protein
VTRSSAGGRAGHVLAVAACDRQQVIPRRPRGICAVDEVKDIRDKAQALEIYQRQARNTDAEWKACEIRLRAERRCGQLLAEMEKARGARGNPGGQGATIVRSHDATTQSLADLGITKTQSSRWQKLAA